MLREEVFLDLSPQSLQSPEVFELHCSSIPTKKKDATKLKIQLASKAHIFSKIKS